jgi:nucleoside-diphosphate-sugar epimerase
MTIAGDKPGGQNWRGVRALVTGARGFIGTCLCRRLVENGAVVQAISSSATPPTRGGITWARVDLADAAAVQRIVASSAPDVVFHLAGHVTGSHNIDAVQPTLIGNLVSTVHLLSAAAKAGAPRVVVAGSMREPEHSGADTRFGSPYAVSKWAANGYARLFNELYELPVIVARLMMVYGPGQWDSTKLVPHVVTSLLEGRSPALTSGAAQADWVFVDDVADGLLGAATVADGQEVEIGSGQLTTVRTVVEQIASLVRPTVPLQFGTLPDRPFERARAARIDDARKLFGWVAKTGLDDGLRQTVDWYRGTVTRPDDLTIFDDLSLPPNGLQAGPK